MDSRISGLYAITADTKDTALLVEHVGAALRGGASVVQYRNKSASAGLQAEQVIEVSRQVRAAGATFIVNDSIELAKQTGVDGVHLGRDDGTAKSARDRLGPDFLIGVSCYDQLDRALAAEQAGADYVAFGSMFASNTKPEAVRAPIALLSNARAVLRVPIVAIGGVTASNCTELIEAGADAVAVSGAVFGAADIEAAAAAIADCFDRDKATRPALMIR